MSIFQDIGLKVRNPDFLLFQPFLTKQVKASKQTSYHNDCANQDILKKLCKNKIETHDFLLFQESLTQHVKKKENIKNTSRGVQISIFQDIGLKVGLPDFPLFQPSLTKQVKASKQTSYHNDCANQDILEKLCKNNIENHDFLLFQPSLTKQVKTSKHISYHKEWLSMLCSR